jgi:antibiotic biosynthesis monooxygenase (ABM) superfamily enzyme
MTKTSRKSEFIYGRLAMIRVLIERILSKRENISTLIRQIRIAAMAQPGYISSETLLNSEGNGTIMIISTWANVESWKKWEASEQRVTIDKEIEPLLEKPQTIRIYQIISTEEMEYLEDPEGWLQLRERHSLGG